MIRRWVVHLQPQDGESVEVTFAERTRLYTCSRCGALHDPCWHALAALIQSVRVTERTPIDDRPAERRPKEE